MIWDRIWKKSLGLFFILTIMCFYSLMPVYTISGTNHSNNQTIKSNHWVTVNNFADFSMRNDVSSIESFNNDQMISFQQFIHENGGNDEYIYLFDYNCRNFYLNITLNYYFQEHNAYENLYATAYSMASSSVVLASRYNEDGDIYNNGELGLCYAAIGDSESCYRLGAYPNDTRDSNKTNTDDVYLLGVAKFHFERVNDILSCKLLHNGKVVLSKTWSSGVSKPVNMIIIDAFTNLYYETLSINYTSISGELEFTTKPSSSQPETTNPTVKLRIQLFLFPVFLICFYLCKRFLNKRKKN